MNIICIVLIHAFNVCSSLNVMYAFSSAWLFSRNVLDGPLLRPFLVRVENIIIPIISSVTNRHISATCVLEGKDDKIAGLKDEGIFDNVLC